MGKMNDAELALSMLKDGENPLENYEVLKAAIKAEPAVLDIVYNIIPNKVLEELNKDKAVKKIIDKYKKELEAGRSKLRGTSEWYMFFSSDEFEEWLKEQKKPYTPKVRRIKFIHGVLKPLMYQWFEDVWEQGIFQRAENASFLRKTIECECGGRMALNKLKKKYICTTCQKAIKEDEAKGKPTQQEIVDGIAIDIYNVIESDVAADSVGKIMVLVLEKLLKDEARINNKKS